MDDFDLSFSLYSISYVPFSPRNAIKNLPFLSLFPRGTPTMPAFIPSLLIMVPPFSAPPILAFIPSSLITFIFSVLPLQASPTLIHSSWIALLLLVLPAHPPWPVPRQSHQSSIFFFPCSGHSIVASMFCELKFQYLNDHSKS